MPDELTYRSLRTRFKQPLSLRVALVQYALEHGIKPAARAFGTSPQTVRLWLGRYRQEGVAGLRERSHRPKKAHPQPVEQRIVALRRANPSAGQSRIAATLREAGVAISSKTVGKILRRHHLIETTAAPARSPRSLHRLPLPKPFDEVQFDVVDLYGACRCRDQITAGVLPRYGFSLRDSSSGAGFMAYARAFGTPNVRCFVGRTLRHLRSFGLKPRVLHLLEGSICFQHKLDRALADALLEHAVVPNLLPAAEADVARSVTSFNRLLESELYFGTAFADESELLAKVWAFERWFNLERRDARRKGSPLELTQRQIPGVDPRVFELEPISLESCRC